MTPLLVPGKQFEFDTLYQDDYKGKSQKFGPVNLFQIGELSCISGYEVPPHKQWCHEISYVISGQGLFTTNNETELLIEGDIHFSPAGSTHAIKTANHSDLRYGYIGFIFNEDAVGESLEQLRDFYANTTVYKASDRSDLLVPIFRNLDELYNKAVFFPLMVESYLMQILISVCRSFTAPPLQVYFPTVSMDTVSRSVYSAIKYIDDNIFEALSVQEISDKIGYNYSYLSNIFKKSTGITIQRYISNKKIQKAIELMRHGKMSVVQVAQRLNYASVQSFNKAFKRTMGCPPTDYMKQCEGEAAAPAEREE